MVEPATPRAVSIISVGVDYLRVTSKSASDQTELQQLYGTLKLVLLGAGHEPKLWSFKGYIGEQTATAAYGQRTDGACLQVSGSLAQVAFSALPVGVGKVTRIDLQVTFDHGRDVPNEAKRQGELVWDHYLHSQNRIRVRPLVIDGYGRGDSCYVGARTSQAFGRIYDKARESKGEYQVGVWRYEIECKYETAQMVAAEIQRAEDQQSAMLSMVHAWLSDRGAVLPFKRTTLLPLPTYKAPRTTAQKKISWLTKYVRKSVLELIDQGYEDEVLHALFWVDHHTDDGDGLD